MATIRDPKGLRQDDDYKGRDRDQERDNDNNNNNDSVTEITIRRERKKVCTELNDKAGVVRQWEEMRTGAHQLYNDKKCCFIATETNYQYYRNLELAVGLELMQANEGIKENTTAYKKWNDELAAVLKEIVKTTKEAKVKFGELKEIACQLNTCVNDSCNSTQRRILTGESYDDCQEGDKQSGRDEPRDKENKEECNSKKVLEDLEDFPKIFLRDIDIIFNSATRVTGIQVFSNVPTLEPLQKTMLEKSKAFDDFIQEKMKKDADDLKKIQEELVKSVQELAKNTSGLYFRRSDFKGVQRATQKLCNPGCDECMQTGDENRLDDCKCDICDICEEVQTGVCKVDDNPACRPQRRPEEQNQSTLTY